MQRKKKVFGCSFVEHTRNGLPEKGHPNLLLTGPEMVAAALWAATVGGGCFDTQESTLT